MLCNIVEKLDRTYVLSERNGRWSKKRIVSENESERMRKNKWLSKKRTVSEKEREQIRKNKHRSKKGRCLRKRRVKQ